MSKKIALVTGGTTGLGACICEMLLSNGYQVFANHLPAMQCQALQFQQRMSDKQLKLELTEGDVTDIAACEHMVQGIVQQHGALSVLVNNAGITRDATLKKMDTEDWRAVIDTNLNSLFYVSKPVVESMREAGFGRIINISSVNGQRGQFGQTNYSAAKAGVHGFTKALAQETARFGITVNTVSPGFIGTDMVKTIPEEQQQQIVALTPVGRMGKPQDIARAVAFLAADDADFITGTEISVNGGLFMH